MCGWVDHGRIMFGSCSGRFRIVNGVSTCFNCFSCMCGRQNSIVICNCRIVPASKWDCKWCWWMSCRWSFEGSLARNAFLRDSRCTKPYVFPYKVRPRTSMIYLCGATVARRSRVWLGGSWADHVRIMLGSVPHCKWGFNMFQLFFVHLRSTEFHCGLQL